MKRVAIVGAGIVGVSAAYTLKKHGISVDVYDANYAQGTSAAVGIICPWVNQRRNKKWFKLANDGADFYLELIKDFPNQEFYQANGTLITHPTRLESLYDLAKTREANSQAMQEVLLLDKSEVGERIPDQIKKSDAIYVKGGAQVDGKKLLETLLKSQSIDVIPKKVRIVDGMIDGISYDAIIIACGPWINEVSDYKFDVYPQKGQLIEINDFFEGSDYPVIMPKGELDILFGDAGKLVIGASHENHKDDTLRDRNVEKQLIEDAKEWIDGIDESMISGYRIGIRAYTPKNEPFYGPVNDEGLYVASGLGSSGLTVGPIIGHRIAMDILGVPTNFDDFNPKYYIKKEEQ